MSDIDDALARLDAALDRAEDAVGRESESNGRLAADFETVRAERDRLAAEVRILREAAKEDAELRAEAADAVKTALADLRGLVHEESRANA